MDCEARAASGATTAGAASIAEEGNSSLPTMPGQANCTAPTGRQCAAIGLQNPDWAQAAAAKGASENTLWEAAPVDQGRINPAGCRWWLFPLPLLETSRPGPGSRRERPANPKPIGAVDPGRASMRSVCLAGASRADDMSRAPD